MDFQQACEAVLARQHIKKSPSFSAILKCLERLGNPHRGLRAVHVAGTNGKGSVCALTAAALTASGAKTGMFTSPHLLDIRERIMVDGEMISRAEFAQAVANTLAAEPGVPEKLTFFEILTCAAFLHFKRRGVDAAVMETGIGGRLDVTNILENPALCIITSISLDHVQMLGDTVEKIAFEKAGIMKKGVPCVCGPLPSTAETVMAARAGECGAPLTLLRKSDAFAPVETDWEHGRSEIKSPQGKTYTLALLGETQSVNAAIVSQAVEILNTRGFAITDAHLRRAFATVNWPARFQVLHSGGTTWILDGGHNEEAAAGFARAFSASPFSLKRPIFIIGVMADKDYRAILRELAPLLNRVIATKPASPRALDPMALADAVAEAAPDADIQVESSLENAICAAQEAGTAVIIGSFYLAGAAIPLLKSNAITAGKC
jgi:dihydrofolate synthase/folylpolyglutamate synthase